mgnify:FL=1|tara:strand:- start:133 stop:576 length:444 start_codon:yes stop_codon:yes gene_type:complete
MSDNQEAVNKAIEVSVKFCSYRERSEKEIIKKLTDKEFSKEIISSTLRKMKDLNFVNNLRFAKSFSRGKNRGNRWGKIKIRYELVGKGLNDEEITIGLDSIDSKMYEESLKKNIEIFRKKNKSDNKNKLIGHLARKGFEMNLILNYI